MGTAEVRSSGSFFALETKHGEACWWEAALRREYCVFDISQFLPDWFSSQVCISATFLLLASREEKRLPLESKIQVGGLLLFKNI